MLVLLLLLLCLVGKKRKRGDCFFQPKIKEDIQGICELTFMDSVYSSKILL